MQIMNLNLTFLKNTVSAIFGSKAAANVASQIVNKQPAVKKTVYIQKPSEPVKHEPVKSEPVAEPVKTPDYSGICIILDPGHAKSTPGKLSPYSAKKQEKPALPLEEWKFNREIVKMLQQSLSSYGFDTFITTDEKDGDTDVKLTTRATRGYNYVKKSNKAGIFISIHADAHGYGDQWTSANGWSVYTTKGQTISDELA